MIFEVNKKKKNCARITSRTKGKGGGIIKTLTFFNVTYADHNEEHLENMRRPETDCKIRLNERLIPGRSQRSR